MATTWDDEQDDTGADDEAATVESSDDDSQHDDSQDTDDAGSDSSDDPGSEASDDEADDDDPSSQGSADREHDVSEADPADDDSDEASSPDAEDDDHDASESDPSDNDPEDAPSSDESGDAAESDDAASAGDGSHDSDDDDSSGDDGDHDDPEPYDESDDSTADAQDSAGDEASDGDPDEDTDESDGDRRAAADRRNASRQPGKHVLGAHTDRRTSARHRSRGPRGELVDDDAALELGGDAGLVTDGSADAGLDANGAHARARGKVLLGAGGQLAAKLHHKEHDPATGLTVERTTTIKARAEGGLSGDGDAELQFDAEHGGRARLKGKLKAGGELDLDVEHRVHVSQGDVHARSKQRLHARAFAGAEADGDAALEIGLDGARATVGGEVFVGARGEVTADSEQSLDAGLGRVGVKNQIKAHAEAGAGAEAHLRTELGPHGVGVDAHAGAFAGAKAGISSKSGLTVEGLDVFSVKTHVDGLAGAGVVAAVHAHAGDDGITLGGDADASAGLGLGAGVEVSFNPANAIKAADAVAHKTAETLSHLPQDPLGTLDKLQHDAAAVLVGLLPLPRD